MQQRLVVEFQSSKYRITISFQKINRKQYLPFGVKILNSKILIPKKYIIIFRNYIWMQETFGKPPTYHMVLFY